MENEEQKQTEIAADGGRVYADLTIRTEWPDSTEGTAFDGLSIIQAKGTKSLSVKEIMIVMAYALAHFAQAPDLDESAERILDAVYPPDYHPTEAEQK